MSPGILHHCLLGSLTRTLTLFPCLRNSNMRRDVNGGGFVCALKAVPPVSPYGQPGYPPQGYPPQGYPPQQQMGYPPQQQMGYPPQQGT